MKFVNEKNNVQFVAINVMFKSLSRGITTREEYFEWVREWKIDHQEMVDAIKFFRAQKDRATNSDDANRAWAKKKSLRPFAHKLYVMRITNKGLFKSGQFEKEEVGA